MSDTPIFFNGAVQFKRYSDTSTQGQQVVFALEDDEALAPFKGKEGCRFMAVLVELGNDEMPVVQDGFKAPRKDTRGPLCREACDLCAMPEFREWIASGLENPTEAAAKSLLCEKCGVTSRKDLDTVPTAGAKFVSLIRGPFMKWQREQRRPRPIQAGMV